MKCNVCGTEQDPGKYCISCGSPMEDDGDERTYLLDKGQNPLFNLDDFEEEKTVKAAEGVPVLASSGQKASICTVCGSKLQPGDRVCAVCGSPVGEAPVRQVQQPEAVSTVCTTCGSRMQPGTKVCQICGMPAAAAPVRSTPQINPRIEKRPAPIQTSNAYDSFADDEEKTQKMDSHAFANRAASMFEAPPVPEQKNPRSGSDYFNAGVQAPMQPQSRSYPQEPYGGAVPNNDYQQTPYGNGYQNNSYPQMPYGNGYPDNGYQQTPYGKAQPNAYADNYPNKAYQQAAYSKTPAAKSTGKGYVSGALEEIYDLTGGIFMLIFAALFSINLIMSIVIHSTSVVSFGINAVTNIFQILFCIALWMIFVNGKKEGTSTGGFTIIGVIMKIYMIFGIIGYVLLILIGVVGGAAMKSLLEQALETSVNNIYIFIAVYAAVIIIIMILFILYWSKLGRMNKSIAMHIRTGEGRVYGAVYPLVFMIIGVIGKVITLIVKLVYSGAIIELIRELESTLLTGLEAEYAEMYEQYISPMIAEVLQIAPKYLISEALAVVVAVLIVAAIIKVGPAKRESM